MNKLLLLLTAGALLGLTACIDEIDFSAPQPAPIPSIQGQVILGDPTVAEVLVETIFESNSSLPRPLTSGRVKLIDDQGGEIDLPHVENGLYRVEIPRGGNGEVDMRVGGSYSVEVRFPDLRIFRSEPERLYPAPQATNLSVRESSQVSLTAEGLTQETFTLQYAVSTSLTVPGEMEKSRLRWVHEATYALTDTPEATGVDPKTCYLRNRPGQFEIFLLDGNDLGANTVEEYDLLETPPSVSYAEGNVMTVYQQALSPATYRYFFSIEDLVTRTGNMFESIPASAPSNFVNINDPDDLVLGWFYATEQDTIRRYVSPEMARNPGKACPDPPSMSPNPSPTRCDDCLLPDGSTTVRPDYFPE
jgi:hypothetical protein